MNEPAGRTAAASEIRSRIEQRGSIPFSEFMELALYHPGSGYYRRDAATTGPRGDFSTSSDVSPLFGRRLALQAADVHERLGGESWHLVELGGGRGLLATDMLDGLAEHAPHCLASLDELVFVETSETLAAEQAARAAHAHPGTRVRTVSSLAELGDGSISGFVFGNELLDALPVHAVTRTESGLAELHVARRDDDELCFTSREIGDERVRTLVERYGLCPRPGDRAEVCPRIDGLFTELARVVSRGALLLIDYGHEAARLADPDHAAGTLVAYRGHRPSFDVLADPGRQDLTAHVNWTHVEDAARASGFGVAGRVTQDRLLLALGLLEEFRLEELGRDFTPAEVGRRLAAKRLIMPGAGGGKRFQALLLVRAIDADLLGLRPPDSWPR